MVLNRNKMAALAIGSLALFGGAANAQTTALGPNGTVTPPPTVNAAPFDGTFLQTNTSTYTGTNAGNTISGTLISTVYSTTSGPFGSVATPTLDFYYQVIAGAGSTTGVDSFSLSSFAPGGVVALTSIGQDTDGGIFGQTATGVANLTSASRGGSGIGIVVSLSSATNENGLTAGNTAASFIVRTNATSFSTTGGAAFLGVAAVSANSTANVLAPGSIVAAAPEPGSLALLGTSAMGVVGMVIRRRRAK